MLSGLAVWGQYRAVWLTWSLGDLVGNWILTPLILLWATEPPPSFRPRRLMEAAVLRRYAEEKKKLDGDANRKYAAIALKNLEADHARRLSVLQENRDTYKARLNEPAEISTFAPSSLLNEQDIFEGTGNSALKLPVYTIDSAITERAKTDQPQWIVVSWTAADGRDEVLTHLQQSLLMRFDLEYLRN